MSKIIDAIENEQMQKEVPEFAPGDTVTVQVKVKEGNRERLQAFEGVVIAKVMSGQENEQKAERFKDYFDFSEAESKDGLEDNEVTWDIIQKRIFEKVTQYLEQYLISNKESGKARVYFKTATAS